MFVTMVFSLISIAAIVASLILSKTCRITDKIRNAVICGGFLFAFITVVSAALGGGSVSMALAVTAADVFMGLPCMIYGKTGNGRLRKFTQKNRKWLSAVFVSVAVVLLCEVFVCNFGAFRLVMPSSPGQMEMSVSQSAVNGGTINGDTLTVNSGESASIEFKNVGREVATIYVDVSSSDSPSGTVDIAYSDETSAAYRHDAHLNYINNDENSKYIICSFSGKVNDLCFNISATDTVTVKSISINKDIPFDFSWVRFIIILVAVLFLVTLAYLISMRKAVEKSLVFKIATAVVTAGFVFVAVVLLLVRGDMVYDLFKNPDTNQMNKEIVDSFEAGQVSMLETPSDEMLALENPYDLSQRSEAGVSYPWDHLFYDGKYYSYYGIGTVLTLFLPYHLITGNYFPSLWATFIYSIAGIIFLSLSYYVFITRLFPKISKGIAISGLVIVQATSFVWYCITIGNFYELAQVSGFAFLTAGMFFLLRSGVVGEGKISRPNICVATVLLSIAVLCRAVLALYCIVSLLFIYAGVRKIIRTSYEHTFRANKKPVITFLLAALVPFAVIGSVQMIYNYLRFGSILDFGIYYTLTIYDYQHIQFHFPLVLIAIYNYLFTVPKVSTVFPFVTSNYDSLSVNGYYFLAGFSSAGIIFRSVPVLGYIFSGKAYKRSANPNKRLAAIIIILGCILVPLIQMAMIWEYGYTPRYAVDFAWQMLFGAFAVWFVIHEHTSAPVKKIMYILFAVSAVISVIINFALVYEFVMDYGNTLNGIPLEIKEKMLSFGRLFEFWNII
ncbi:MAG: hypothetical protein ACLSGN_01015 [Oscillospiraceae bacterium]